MSNERRRKKRHYYDDEEKKNLCGWIMKLTECIYTFRRWAKYSTVDSSEMLPYMALS